MSNQQRAGFTTQSERADTSSIDFSDMLGGFLKPRRALMYLLLGHKRYFYIMELLAMRDALAKIRPGSLLEAISLKETDIHEHLITLYMLTTELKLKTIVELGTRGGESAMALLLAAREIGGRVHSFDIDPCLEAARRIKENDLQELWEFTQGDDLKANWTATIDHLFIDTSHTYEQTMAELKKFEPHLRRGGIITLHDIVKHPEFCEVLPAVEDYIKGRDDLRLHKYFNNHGLGIIFKS